MSTSTWVRRGEVKSSGFTANYAVTKHGKGYRVHTTVGLNTADLGTTYFDKPNGLSVETKARALAHEALLTALAVATDGPHLYVRVDGLPGYASRKVAHLTGCMVTAAYRMNHDTGVPVTTYRVTFEDEAAVEAFRVAVEGRDFSADERKFGTAKVTVTRDVSAAVDSPYSTTDGVTYLAASFAAEREEG